MTRSLGEASRYCDAERASDRRREDDASPGSPRLRLYRDMWEWLRPMTEHDRATALHAIGEWAGFDGAGPDGDARPLSREELLVLAGSPMITIGAHSVTHAPLSTLTRAEQQHEIAASKAQLESMIGREVANFAYPFGDRGADAPTLVRDAGFRSSCTTEAEAVRPSSDPFLLPRIGVGNCNGETFARMLQGLH
jgi:peptidoglycan/xylan/chitin deacetylase (PgdA/CDA1 family)